MRREKERRARSELEWSCARGLEFPELVARASAAIAHVVPHERFCFHTVDPETLLMTGGLAQNLAPRDGYPRMLHNEYVEDDVNKWADLAGRPNPAATLTDATEGRPDRSVRYRELLRPHSCASELRVSLVEKSSCWGAVGLYRSDGERDFDPDEVRFLASVSPVMAGGFRRSLVAGDLPEPEGHEDAPGVIVFEADLAVGEISPAAARWIDELRGPAPAGDDLLPAQIWAVATRVAGPPQPHREARTRVRASSGRWLVLHGTPLGDSGRVAVVVEPARARELAPFIAAAYGLTPRESAITALVLRGLPTSEIADQEHLSPYTVQDHLKSVFAKTGVRSRRELVARVFFEQHHPRIAGGARPGRSGAFTG